MRNASKHPIVCCVTSGERHPTVDRQRRVLSVVTEALRAGADWIQIREKDLSARVLLAITREVVENARLVSSHILVNDRLDVALAGGATGVHLTRESISAASVVQWCRDRNVLQNFGIGVSCHSLEEVQLAEACGATYIFFGPVFDTPSKKAFGSPQGVERLAAVCSTVRIPVIAIGGINDVNAKECLQAGASGIAAIRLFEKSHDSTELAELISHLHAFG